MHGHACVQHVVNQYWYDAVVVHCDPLLYPLMGGFVHAGLPQKNGVRFEATLRKREQHNPRFAFLVPDSAHHWFYR